jgi:TRAP-type C4-dicarboxylate transport system permease small subunit
MPEQSSSRSSSWQVAVLKGLQRLEKLLVVAAFLLLVVVIFADVVSRELTGAGLHWASQIGVWANVLVVMAGFGLASAEGAHLRPRFTDSWLPVSWEPALCRVQHLCMAVFCLAIGLLAARVVFVTWQLGEVSLELFMPVWPVQLFLPLAFAAATVRHLLYAFFPELRPDESNAMTMTVDESQPDGPMT